MTDHMDTEALQALLEQATRGPWKVAGKSTGYIVANEESALLGVVGDYKDADLLPYNKERWDADAALFAAAKVLAAEVLELRAKLDAEKALADRLAVQLKIAEAALSDIGDAEREDGDDLRWCEQRAAKAIPATRAELAAYRKARGL